MSEEAKALAKQIYDAQCNYVGPNHEERCIEHLAFFIDSADSVVDQLEQQVADIQKELDEVLYSRVQLRLEVIALEQQVAELEVHNTAMERQRNKAQGEREHFREALEMIAGKRPCLDMTLSNDAIAKAALTKPPEQEGK